MSEKAHDKIYKTLLEKGARDAAARLKQPGDAHYEQLLMSYLGHELKSARIAQNLSAEELANRLPATERSILLAEMGLLEPQKFYALLEKWGPFLHVSIQNLTTFFESTMQGPRRLRDI